MYSSTFNGSTYDITTDMMKESDYNMYSSEESSECGEDHIHVGPLVIEPCYHDDHCHVCIYDNKTGEKIAETEISSHGMGDHFQSIVENLDSIYSAYVDQAEKRGRS